MKTIIKLIIVILITLFVISSITVVSATNLPFKQWVDSVKIANNFLPLAYTESVNIEEVKVAFGKLDTYYNQYLLATSKPTTSTQKPNNTTIAVNSSNANSKVIISYYEQPDAVMEVAATNVSVTYNTKPTQFYPITLTIGDTLIADKKYNRVTVKNKGLVLSGYQFDKLFESRKVKQIKNKTWIRVASKPNYSQRFNKGKHTGKASQIRGYSFIDSIENLFKGNPCKR